MDNIYRKLRTDDTVVVMVDIQRTLSRIVVNSNETFLNWVKILKGVRLLGVDLVAIEQYPKGLGPTIPELRKFINDDEIVEKIAFDAANEPKVIERLKSINKKNVVVFGVEAHICVYQTATSLQRLGYNVHVVVDAISSRKMVDHKTAVRKMESQGVHLTTTEMFMFEMIDEATGEKFKEFTKIVK